MNFLETPLADVYLLEPNVFGDSRGFFLETWPRLTLAGHSGAVCESRSRIQA